jgi:hypothetical protein
MKKKSSTINKNLIKKTKWKIKINISNIATQVIFLVMFNEFLYQNKLVIEKHIKFIIETDTHKIYWTIIIYIKKQCKAAHMKNLIKKSIVKKKFNLYKIKKKPQMNHIYLFKN